MVLMNVRNKVELNLICRLNYLIWTAERATVQGGMQQDQSPLKPQLSRHNVLLIAYCYATMKARLSSLTFWRQLLFLCRKLSQANLTFMTILTFIVTLTLGG